MFIKEVTFALTRTIPMQSITGSMGDQYSNLKPHVSVTVAFSEKDHAEDDEAAESAFIVAQDMVMQKHAEIEKSIRDEWNALK